MNKLSSRCVHSQLLNESCLPQNRRARTSTDPNTGEPPVTPAGHCTSLAATPWTSYDETPLVPTVRLHRGGLHDRQIDDG